MVGVYLHNQPTMPASLEPLQLLEPSYSMSSAFALDGFVVYGTCQGRGSLLPTCAFVVLHLQSWPALGRPCPGVCAFPEVCMKGWAH